MANKLTALYCSATNGAAWLYQQIPRKHSLAGVFREARNSPLPTREGYVYNEIGLFVFSLRENIFFFTEFATN